MDGYRKSVVEFSEHVTKTILCRDFGVAYKETYEGTAFYKHALPSVFLSFLHQDQPDGTISKSTWMAMIRAIPEDLPLQARHRCLQIVAEYAATSFTVFADFFLVLNEKSVTEVREALAYFYKPFEDRTCEWMTATVTLDNELFHQMVDRIISGCTSPKTGSNFKRALVYTYQLIHAHNRVYLDNPTGQPTHVLWKLRRAYEHVLFGRFPVDDFTNSESLLKTLIALDEAYTHSSFQNTSLRKLAKRGKEFIIKGQPKKLDLVLQGSPQKHFPLNHYRGALEMMSSCGKSLDTAYVDRRLDHHLVVANKEDFVFDPPAFLPLLETKRKRDYDTVARLFMRMSDYTQANFLQDKKEYLSGPKPMVCHKEMLLKPTNDTACENDNISVACHIKDFLLWVISENPLLTSTQQLK